MRSSGMNSQATWTITTGKMASTGRFSCRQTSAAGGIANKDSNTSTSTIGPPAPRPAADAGSKPVVTVGSGPGPGVAVVAAATCSTIDPPAPPSLKDGGSELVVVVGSGPGPVVAVFTAGTCISETSSLVFEQELTPISERHTTATSNFEMLRSWHRPRAQSGHPTAFRVHSALTEPGLRNWFDIAPDRQDSQSTMGDSP